MADRRTILVCSCEDTMPLDAQALHQGCRGDRLVTGRQFCRAELGQFRERRCRRSTGDDGLHPGGPAVSRGRGRRRRHKLREPSRNRRLVEGRRERRSRRWPRSSPRPRNRRRSSPSSRSRATASSWCTAATNGAVEAAGLLKDHLDVTVLITRPDQVSPPRVAEFPIVKGTIRVGQRPSRRVRDHRRRLCRTVAVVAGRAGVRSRTRRCGLALRHPARPLRRIRRCFPPADLRDGYLRADPGDPAAVLRAVLRARDLVRGFRQAALHRFHRSSVRPFAIEHRRLPALSRSLPDRRHRSRRRPCRDRRRGLRRLRAMRRGLPDRRRRLRAAAGRCLDAAAAHASHGLSRGWRPNARAAVSR